MATVKYLITNILQMVYFCVQQRNETLKCLKQVEGE